MTVLVDTYDIPASAIMSQLYNTMCYEILPDEVYSRGDAGAHGGKKYIVLTDISPKLLLAVRDIESVIYVFHKEMLSDKEYKVLKHYTNELICVENNTLWVTNKKAQKQEAYCVLQSKKGIKIEYRLQKIETDSAARAPKDEPQMSEKQKSDKNASLPFLQAQKEQDVYFPEEEDEDEE